MMLLGYLHILIQLVLGVDIVQYFLLREEKGTPPLDTSLTYDSSSLACRGHSLGYPHPHFPRRPGHRVSPSI